MPLRLSTGLANFLAGTGSLKQALHNGKLKVYSGAQPASADDAPSGTLLCTYTKGSAAHTAEVLATGSVTLSSGSSGSVNGITVNGVQLLAAAVPYNTSLTQTAADVAAAINRNITHPRYTASAASGVITITATAGSGAGPNTFVVTPSFTTISGSSANMSGGVNAANGLVCDAVASGTLTKPSSETWSGSAVASGVAGWARFEAAVADPGTSSTTAIRLDGSVGNSGAFVNITNTSISSGAPQTIDSVSLSQPQS